MISRVWLPFLPPRHCGKCAGLLLSPPGRETQCSRKNRRVGSFAGWGTLLLGCRAACAGAARPGVAAAPLRAAVHRGQSSAQGSSASRHSLSLPWSCPRLLGGCEVVVLAGDFGRVGEELQAFRLTPRGFQPARGASWGHVQRILPGPLGRGAAVPAAPLCVTTLLVTRSSPAGAASPPPRGVAGLDWAQPRLVEGC